VISSADELAGSAALCKATVVLPTGLEDRGRELARDFTDHA
jgi:hypothetical protein